MQPGPRPLIVNPQLTHRPSSLPGYGSRERGTGIGMACHQAHGGAWELRGQKNITKKIVSYRLFMYTCALLAKKSLAVLSLPWLLGRNSLLVGPAIGRPRPSTPSRETSRPIATKRGHGTASRGGIEQGARGRVRYDHNKAKRTKQRNEKITSSVRSPRICAWPRANLSRQAQQ